jgi:hypothetical protein
MGMRSLVALPVVLCLLGATAQRARAQDLPRLVVPLGGAIALDLHLPASIIICDDKELVRIVDAHDHLNVEGLRLGQTLCSFWLGTGAQALKKTYEVVVVESRRR